MRLSTGQVNKPRGGLMRELLRTNNAVRLSYLQALLKAERITTVVLDENISILEGSIGIFPRRLMVDDEDYERACWVLDQLGEEHGPE